MSEYQVPPSEPHWYFILLTHKGERHIICRYDPNFQEYVGKYCFISACWNEVGVVEIGPDNGTRCVNKDYKPYKETFSLCRSKLPSKLCKNRDCVICK